jgi:hypothetical protein
MHSNFYWFASREQGTIALIDFFQNKWLRRNSIVDRMAAARQKSSCTTWWRVPPSPLRWLLAWTPGPYTPWQPPSLAGGGRAHHRASGNSGGNWFRSPGGGDPLAGGTPDGDRRCGRLGSAAEARTEAGEIGPMAGAWPASGNAGGRGRGRILAGGVGVGADSGDWTAGGGARGWGGRRRGEVRAGRRWALAGGGGSSEQFGCQVVVNGTHCVEFFFTNYLVRGRGVRIRLGGRCLFLDRAFSRSKDWHV